MKSIFQIALALLALCFTSETTLLAITTNELGPQHQIKILTQSGYLPGVPVLVRVEVRYANGPERKLWDANATLTVDQPGVTLSTNRVQLRNGLGSALVAFRGGANFNLTAAVG